MHDPSLRHLINIVNQSQVTNKRTLSNSDYLAGTYLSTGNQLGLNSISTTLSDDLLLEGLFDKTKQFLGNKAQEVVTVVTNTTQAMQVLYKVFSNAEFLNTATFLLKKMLKQKMKLITAPALKSIIVSKFPQGREVKDFIITLIFTCVSNAWLKKFQGAISISVDQIKDQITDYIVQQLRDIYTWIPKFADPSMIFTALGIITKVLNVSNEIILQPLAYINQKIVAAPYDQVKPNTTIIKEISTMNSNNLREWINLISHSSALNEEIAQPTTVDTSGTADLAQISTLLGVDSAKFAAIFTKLKSAQKGTPLSKVLTPTEAYVMSGAFWKLATGDRQTKQKILSVLGSFQATEEEPPPAAAPAAAPAQKTAAPQPLSL